MKLTQKHLLKGTRHFEIIDDSIFVRIKTPFNKERLTVSLTTLNPEPVVNAPYLEFHSRATGEPVLALFLDRPSPEEFNAFVDMLKRAMDKYSTSAGAGTIPDAAALGGNVQHPPPEFEDTEFQLRGNAKAVDVARLEHAIQMLETYLVAEDIRPLLSALEALKTDPENESKFAEFVAAFDDLGIQQGAVLTYAPYIGLLLSENPY